MFNIYSPEIFNFFKMILNGEIILTIISLGILIFFKLKENKNGN